MIMVAAAFVGIWHGLGVTIVEGPRTSLFLDIIVPSIFLILDS